MASYKITISKTAQKQLNKIQDNIAEKLIPAIYELADNPRPYGCKKLKGRDAWRIRVGDYRIIYEIHDGILLIDIIALGHRRDIYS
ncbi:type II toxin-antitoxin system RelE/ParE family toxin [Mucilaginibacter conchicola]|uniref:Type II toxin-antitoxin system RelE/ParE family toxin n=1 Tax=Mucilaginibacter conchicola TaxID=2303333 RepID=A0A372NYV5_9SPHI|nr:type II toxin-antitoxin system RelE/ParE family toxin [Mucilaginibacter conchicola]RFZ95212.1 type II toxin-antitoxin system RelE/ParE family toxin [Mucilaginibacter conchicola]